MRLRVIISLFTLMSVFLLDAAEKARKPFWGRRQDNVIKNIRDIDVRSAGELEKDAERLISQGKYDLAIRRYQLLRKFYPGYKPDLDLLLIIAGLQYEAAQPKQALESIEMFGEKYPDSQKISHMVDLAYEIGKNYCTSEEIEYRKLARYTLAAKAFEFVNEHDPYNIKAAKGLFSIAFIYMKRDDWEDAVDLLKEIEKKHAGTKISARAEVALGECYLGTNKGSVYSRELIDKAIAYLEGYLRRYKSGDHREKAKRLLGEAYRRVGVSEIRIIRFYCSQKKWTAARMYLRNLLKNEKLDAFHGEALELLRSIEKRTS